MVKKNKNKDNMGAFSNFFGIYKQVKELVIVISAIFLWLLGVWLTGRLTPLVKDISVIANSVESNESRIKYLENSCFYNKEKLIQIAEDVSYIKGKLEK